MAVAPTGPMGLTMQNLRDLVAASTSFQDWIGATGTPAEKLAAAKARIYMVAEDSPALPCGYVRFASPADWRSFAVAGGAVLHFSHGGTLQLAFEATVASGLDDDDAEITFFNNVDAVISDIEDLAGSDGYFAARSIEVFRGPIRASADESHSTGDYYQMVFNVAFGGEEPS